MRVGDVKGIPIISLEDDQKLGYVRDPLYDNQQHIDGFLLDLNRISFGKRYILLEDVLRLDRNALVIFNEHSIKKLPRNNSYKIGLNGTHLFGKKVQNKEGTNLGTVKDLIFDSDSGKIKGLEISRGFLEDVVDGRNVIMMKNNIECGEEFIVIEGGEFIEKKHE